MGETTKTKHVRAKVRRTKGQPIQVRAPNAETKRAIRDVRARRNIETFKSVSDWAEAIRKSWRSMRRI
jgi:hypothetical protein